MSEEPQNPIVIFDWTENEIKMSTAAALALTCDDVNIDRCKAEAHKLVGQFEGMSSAEAFLILRVALRAVANAVIHNAKEELAKMGEN